MHEASSRAALAPLGWDERRDAELAHLLLPDAVPARICRVDRGGGLALSPARTTRVSGAGLAAGDWVALRGDRIAAVLTRRTRIARRAAGRADAEQVLAANVDMVLIVHGADRPLRPRRIHRSLAMAWDSGAEPAIALTKSDLSPEPGEAARIEAVAPGVPVHVVSVLTGEGLDGLARAAAPGRTIVLLGESGAGKSSLVNALVAGADLATSAVRAGDAKGRHTTTARHLVPLPGGGAIIDTPGLRELGLWGAERGVEAAFADIDDLAEGCRFADCRHESEPGCAVRAAVDAGELEPERLDSLRDLRRELAALERRSDARAQRAHGRAGQKAYRARMREKGRGPRG